jgi:hypothetical protein
MFFRIAAIASETWISHIIRYILHRTTDCILIETCWSLAGQNEWWIDEVSAQGIRTVPLTKSDRNIIAEFKCNFEVQKKYRDVEYFIGDKYDFISPGIIGFITLLWRHLRKKIKKPLNNTTGQFSSEFAARLFMAVNLKNTEKWEPESITPQLILDYCSKHPEYFTLVTEHALSNT